MYRIVSVWVPTQSQSAGWFALSLILRKISIRQYSLTDEEVRTQKCCMVRDWQTGFLPNWQVPQAVLQTWMSVELRLVQKCHRIDSCWACLGTWQLFSRIFFWVSSCKYKKNKSVSNLGISLSHQRMVVLAFEVLNYGNLRLVFH